MAAGLPRDLLKWVASMELSMQMKHTRRDFANGYLIAEILWRYFPRDIQFHAFLNVSSTERKALNWRLLTKFFKKHAFNVSEQQIGAIMAAEPDAAATLLRALYNWLHGTEKPSNMKSTALTDALRGSVCLAGGAREGASIGSSSRWSSADEASFHMGASHVRASLDGSEAAQGSLRGDESQTRRGIDWSAVLNQPDRLHFVGDAMKDDPFRADAMEPHRRSTRGGFDAFQASIGSQRFYEDASPPPSLGFASSKSMPPLGRTNSGRGSREYWVLGRLGPDLQDPELHYKQRLYDRVKQFSERVNDANMAMKRRNEAPTSLVAPSVTCRSRRSRALEYSKSIPRPVQRDASYIQRQKEKAEKRVLTDLQRLENEHQAHRERMKAIAEEMQRRGA